MELTFEVIKKKYNDNRVELNLLNSTRQDLSDKKERWDTRLGFAEKAAIIIQEVAKQTQQNLEFHISNIVTSALYAVGGKEWPEFVARFDTRKRAKGSQIECNLLFKEGEHEYKPELGSGGGAMDVASFTLRIAYWLLKKNRPVIIVDEPFKHVSPDLQPRTSKMAKMVADSKGLQILLTSHAEDIEDYANNTIKVSKVKGISQITSSRKNLLVKEQHS